MTRHPHPHARSPHRRPGLAEGRETAPRDRGRLRRTGWLGLIGVVGPALALAPAGLHGQDEAAGWSNSTELAFLLTGGNSGASTLGLRNTLEWTGDAGEFRISLSATRTDATEITRFAEGTGPDDFVVREESDTERTAERYAAETRYDRNVSERFFVYGGAGWSRNTFAGFDNRSSVSVGAGNHWGPGEEDWLLKLAYGLTYTAQDDIVATPDVKDSFVGARVTLDHVHQFTEGTSGELEWVLDTNAERGEDVRGDFTQAVTAELNDHLSLKSTLQVLWDNDPPLERVPLLEPGGEPTQQEVLVPFEPVDYNLSVALVVTL